jgi:pantothenate kinase
MSLGKVHVGIDIGGTLAKVVVVATSGHLKKVSMEFSSAVMIHEKFSAEEHDIHPSDLGYGSATDAGDLAFEMFSFDSRDIKPLLRFLEKLLVCESNDHPVIRVTGGGALKFRSEFNETFQGSRFMKIDEMDAIATGFTFLVERTNSSFIFNALDSSWAPVPQEELISPYPLLLVNIGSGVSMLRIDSPTDFTRVQGSPIGGGTVLGLCRALFGAKSFEEIMELSMMGNSGAVDLSVGELIGAPPDDDFWNYNTLASSLTKLNTLDRKDVSRADLAQSVVRMVSYNIGYLAYLVSLLHDCPRIYFSGKYVNKHIPTMEAISYAVKFYENWKPPPTAEESVAVGPESDFPSRMEPHEIKRDVRFLHQEGYVGAIGALLAAQN